MNALIELIGAAFDASVDQAGEEASYIRRLATGPVAVPASMTIRPSGIVSLTYPGNTVGRVRFDHAETRRAA